MVIFSDFFIEECTIFAAYLIAVIMNRILLRCLLILALAGAVSCGPVRQATRQAQPTAVTPADVPALADSIWVFSQTHPDGFTLHIRSWQEPSRGIAVAYAETDNHHGRDGLDFVVRHALTHDGYIGGWLDTQTGDYYFDSVRLFPEDSLSQALDFGRQNRQKAIYILSSGKEIRL